MSRKRTISILLVFCISCGWSARASDKEANSEGAALRRIAAAVGVELPQDKLARETLERLIFVRITHNEKSRKALAKSVEELKDSVEYWITEYEDAKDVHSDTSRIFVNLEAQNQILKRELQIEKEKTKAFRVWREKIDEKKN